MSSSSLYGSYQPGPGMYDANPNKIKSQTPNIGFGTQKRPNHLVKNVEAPGPGNYNLEQKPTGGFKMGQKLNTKLNENPGPGSYEPQVKSARVGSQTFRMGQSARKSDFLTNKSTNELPGPGNYDQSYKDFGKGVPTYKIGIKTEGPRKLDVPGPGSYNTKDSVIKPQSTQSIRFKDSKRGNIVQKEDLDKPGPGNYNQGSTFKGDKGFTIGAKQSPKYNENPGPGAYDAKNDLTKVAPGSQRIPGAKRKTFMEEAPNDLPGPGNYDNGSAFGQSKGFTMGAKQDPRYNDNPGPGAYDAKNDLTKAAQGSQRIPGAKRKTFMEEAPNDLPGPGNYDNGSAFGQSKGFTMGAKQDPRYNDNPGPGAYDAKNDLTKAATGSIRVTSAKRTTFMEEAPNDLPGPGNYDQASGFGNGKAFTIQGRPDPKYNDNPGPGSYDNNKIDSVKPNAPSQRLASGKRTTFVADSQNENPGPGGYMLGSTLGTKAFTIQGKHPDKFNEYPGPGWYDPYREDDDIPVPQSK